MRRYILYTLFVLSVVSILFNSCQSSNDIKQARFFVNGKNVYEKNCQNCHGSQGEGLGSLYPSLQNSKYIKEYQNKLACNIRFGINEMPKNPQLTAIDIAYLINYIGNNFGNSIGFYSQEQTLKDLKSCK